MNIQERLDGAMCISGCDCILRGDLIEDFFEAGAYVTLGREVDRGDSAWLEELKEEVTGRIGPR
jgi:hypothetical protein